LAILVVPARHGSKRLPGKPLLMETGKPLIVHVLEQARKARLVSRAVVATDDARILDAVRKAGGEAVLTAKHHTCGTDRIAEVAAGFPDEPFFVNLQGDEPEIDPAEIDLLVSTLVAAGTDMATLASPLSDPGEFADPSVVKVVMDARGDALYFSRAPIPHDRDGDGPAGRYRHIGIYGFTARALRRFAELEPTGLERTEKLEQLRALGAGLKVRVALVPKAPPGIDTMEAYRAFVTRTAASMQRQGKG
jgi:3-deoxy-manno-octulosonate cytidylyltransferase (CMP-KDO synthetase)